MRGIRKLRKSAGFGYVSTALLLVTTTSCGAPADPITAAVLIGEVESSVAGTIESAGNQYNASVQRTALELSNQLDRIEQILGDKVNKPVDQIDTTIQRQLFATRELAEALRKTVAELPQCIGTEGEIALSGVKSGVQTTLAAIPLTDISPTVYYINDPTSRVPFIVNSERFVGRPYALKMHGSALPTDDDYCDLAGRLQSTDSPKNRAATPIEITTGSDSETVGVLLPKGLKAGQYNLFIEAKKRTLGICMGKTIKVGGIISVFDPIIVTPTVTLTPICEKRRIVKQPFSGSCTNASTRRTKVCSATYTFDEAGVRYDDFDFTQSGHSAGASAQRSALGVAVTASASKRGRLEGGRSRVGWSGTLLGHVVEGKVPGKPISVGFPSGLRPGQASTASFDEEVEKACFIIGWSAYADDPAQRLSTPPASNDPAGQIQATSAEITMVADMNSKKITVSRSKAGCL